MAVTNYKGSRNCSLPCLSGGARDEELKLHNVRDHPIVYVVYLPSFCLRLILAPCSDILVSDRLHI